MAIAAEQARNDRGCWTWVLVMEMKRSDQTQITLRGRANRTYRNDKVKEKNRIKISSYS